LLNSKAIPQEDGSYSVTGNKIFITGGDQDWTDNIIHLVLARLPDAPAGVRGISFIFWYLNSYWMKNGEPGEKNAVGVGSIEKKMGIKGSPTCVMNYDDAKGWVSGRRKQGTCLHVSL